MKKNSSLSITDILDRIRHLYSLHDLVQVAKFLGVAPQTISSWKERNTIKAELLYSKCVGVNMHWLLTGDGEMFASDKAGLKAMEAFGVKETIAELQTRKEELERGIPLMASLSDQVKASGSDEDDVGSYADMRVIEQARELKDVKTLLAFAVKLLLEKQASSEPKN